jgi:hypothetical protein
MWATKLCASEQEQNSGKQITQQYFSHAQGLLSDLTQLARAKEDAQ